MLNLDIRRIVNEHNLPVTEELCPVCFELDEADQFAFRPALEAVRVYGTDSERQEILKEREQLHAKVQDRHTHPYTYSSNLTPVETHVVA